jgi:hypothetical protein
MHTLLINPHKQEQRILYASLCFCLIALFWFLNTTANSPNEAVLSFIPPAFLITSTTLSTYWMALHIKRMIT